MAPATAATAQSARRRPLTVGLVLVGLYLVAAVATMALSGRPFRPLFDGLAPPLPYRWVNPPKEVARDNQQPTPATRDFPLAADGSPFMNVTTEDGQAILLVDAKAVAPHPPDTSVRVAVTPLDVLTLGPLPPKPKQTPQSNAYRVEMTYQPSGTAVTDLTLAKSSIAVVAAGPSDYLYASADGQAWTKRSTTPLGANHGLETPFTGPGYYTVTSIAGAGGGSGAPPVVIALVLVAPPLVIGGLAIRKRRAEARAAAARAAAKAAAKRRGPPKKGGRK